MFIINVNEKGDIIDQTNNNLFNGLSNIYNSPIGIHEFQLIENSKLHLINVFDENYTVLVLKSKQGLLLVFNEFNVYYLVEKASLKVELNENEKCVAFCFFNGYMQDKEIILFLSQNRIIFDEFKVKYIVKCLLSKFNATSRTELLRLLTQSNIKSQVPNLIIKPGIHHNSRKRLSM